MKGVLALVGILAVAAASPQRTFASCGYESCPTPKEGYLNLHLVPHTHDDVGWLKTYDQYYYGTNESIQDAGVQFILDSVVQELLHDVRKRFIYVETAYFWKWWMEQSDTMRHQVKKLVNRGQLEFVGGAWSMHDEACTHYQSMLDQTTWGFRKLKDTFGECGRPRVGWQIDPFGHSRENAHLMARYGFDGLFLGRIDFEDKANRESDKAMEMIWHTSANDESDATKLFTGVLYNTYSSPSGFCFDINCHDDPIVENKKSPMYNAEEKAKSFVKLMLKYADAYKTNNILVTMGDDFMYMSAHMNYKNMDLLIKHINNIGEINGVKPYAFYSTPSCYVKALHGSGSFFPSKSDDFMPYASDPHAFWTGYYTSRPTIKGFERLGNNFLQVCKQVSTLTGAGNTPGLAALREAMGVMQHHDAVTGTEKQHVADDYARILTNAIQQCHSVVNRSLGAMIGENVVLESCLKTNISECKPTETYDKFVVTIYNPLSRPVNRLVILPVLSDTDSYTVLNPKGKEVPSQVGKIHERVLEIPGRDSKAKAQLYFIANDLPPLGFRSFYVSKNAARAKTTKEFIPDGQHMLVGFSNGMSIELDGDGLPVSTITPSLAYYRAAVGNNEVFENRSSGAYIFRPRNNEEPVPIPRNGKPKVTIHKGPVVQEVHITYNQWASLFVRLIESKKFAELVWIVGPIPIDDNIGKEVVVQVYSDEIKNNDIFYTDSNGREYLKRKLNYRPTWDLQLEETISGNYYPVVTTISIADEENRLSVVTDRSQGGSSRKQGHIELMVHRRLLHDDAFGVNEALNETAYGEGLVAIGSHYMSLLDVAEVRKLNQEKILNSWVFISNAESMTADQWQKNHVMEYSALKAPLPDNVQLLTLEPWSGNSILIRLEHIMEKDDDPELSKPVSVDLNDIFKDRRVTRIEEMMLGANIEVSRAKRLIWTETDSEAATLKTRQPGPKTQVHLNPMEIRTFTIHFE